MLNKYNKALLVDICGERVLKDEKYYNDYCFAGASTLLMHICCISQIDREDIEGILRSKLSKRYLLYGEEGDSFRSLYPGCIKNSPDYILELLGELKSGHNLLSHRRDIIKKYITTERDITLLESDLIKGPDSSYYHNIVTKIILAYRVQSYGDGSSCISSERLLDDKHIFTLLSEKRTELLQEILENVKYIEEKGFSYLIDSVFKVYPENIKIDNEIREYSSNLYKCCYKEGLESNKAKYMREVLDSEVLVFHTFSSDEFTSYKTVDNEYLEYPRDELMEAVYNRVRDLCTVLGYGHCFRDFNEIVNDLVCMDLVDSPNFMMKLIELFSLPVDIVCQVNYYILSDSLLRRHFDFDYEKIKQEHESKHYTHILSRLYDSTIDDISVLELQNIYLREYLSSSELYEYMEKWSASGDPKCKHVPRFIELACIEDIIEAIYDDNDRILISKIIPKLDYEIESRLDSFRKYKDFILRLLREFDYMSEKGLWEILETSECVYNDCVESFGLFIAEDIYSLLCKKSEVIHNSKAADIFFGKGK